MQKSHFKPIAIRNDLLGSANEEGGGEEGLRGFKGTSVTLSVHFRSQNCRRSFPCLHYSRRINLRIHHFYTTTPKVSVSFFTLIVLPNCACCQWCQLYFSLHCVAFSHFLKISSEIHDFSNIFVHAYIHVRSNLTEKLLKIPMVCI